MLNIIYGSDNSNRDTLAYSSIGKAAEQGQKVWILVPEQFSLTTEKDIIKKFGIDAQTKIKVITFSRLCNLVLSNKGPLRMQYIDGAGKQIIAARTIRALNGKLENLGATLRRKGFSSTIVELVSEFKRYGISAEQLKLASKSEDDESFSKKLEDLSLILDTFNSFLEKSVSDAEDNLELICDKLPSCDFLSGSLYLMHFRSFTPIEYRVLANLMEKLDICAVMCCDGVRDCTHVFEPIARSCRSLLEIAESKGIACTQTPAKPEAYSAEDLQYLQESFFKVSPKPYSKVPENINVFELSGYYREAEAAADLILRLCRTENRKFSDFLILSRNPNTYTRILPAVFEARGIDIFIGSRRSILTNPFAQMLCSSLDIICFGYSYERIMSIARSGILDIPDSDIDMFENYLLAVNPTHAMWADESWSYCPDGYDIEIINRTRTALSSLSEEILSSLPGHQSAEQFCSAILGALDRLNLSLRLETICDGFAKKNMPYLADEYRQVWNSVISVFSQIATLMDGEPISRHDFCELFKNACSGISVALTPQTQGSVVFSPIDKFRSSETPIVIVLGLTDGVFPMPHSSEGIISDAERRRLFDKGILLSPGADFKRLEEELLIYSVLSSAKEKIYLFYPLSGSDGRMLNPSSIIKKVRGEIFPELVTHNPDFSEDYLRGAEGKSGAFDILCSSLSKVGGDPTSLKGASAELFSYFNNIPEYKERLSSIKESMQNKTAEKLSPESVLSIYGEKIMLSASKLEKYNACAFAYFMNYGLLAKEREIAGIESRSTGSIQHAALYRYFSDIEREKGDYNFITKDDCYEKIYSIVLDEATKSTELLYESSSYYKYVVNRMQGIAARTAWEVVKFYKSSLFRPVGFEITIDTKGEIPALEIKNDNGKTIGVVRGVIDRADSAVIDGKKYISIVDYKSSQKALDERLAAAGVNLQPLLYSDIVCNRLNASPAAMLYMQMTDPIIDASNLKYFSDEEIEKHTNSKIYFGGWISDKQEIISGYSKGGENGEKYIPDGIGAKVSQQELKRRINEANKKIHASALGIYDGNISVNPYKDKNFDACEYCDYSSICKYSAEK